MKTKLLLSALLSFSFCLLSSQVPQGFNYQAIARDGTGAVLVSQLLPVRITIQTTLDGGTKIWEETHSVTTNQFGIMTFVIGDGTRTGGSATLFSDINWSAQTLYLKTEILYPGPGYTEMGITQLWSVPYSMVAKNLGGPVDKLGVKGTTSNMEEALFEVKNKGGQTVFAVYNEGVRIYIDDGDAKGAKGGFAIGGFGTTKAGPQEYFIVNADSIRAYIFDDPLVKTPKGGFAIGGFDNSKGMTNDYMLISPDSARIYIDKAPSTKGAKGGFAIGGFDNSKTSDEEYLRVTRDSTRIYVNESAKGAKGGFAIGGFGTDKGNTTQFTSLTPENYFIGHEAGNSITTGKFNSFIGYQSGKLISTGNSNTFMGYQSGFKSTAGLGNLYIGYQAGYSATTGNASQFIGYMSGYSNTTGTVNTFVGTYSGLMNTKGSYNTYVGNNTGGMDSIGKYNAFYGFETGSMTQGSYDTYIGSKSGNENPDGSYNSYLGTYSGGRSTGSNNVFLGYNSGNASDATGSVYLGYYSGYSFDRSNSLIIANSNVSPYDANALIYGEFDNKLLRINGQLYLPYNSGNSVMTLLSGNGNSFFFKPEADLIRIQSNHTGNPTIMTLDKYGQVGIGSTLTVDKGLYAAVTSGSVGIGTSSPSFTFHVYKSSSTGTWLSTFQNGTCSVQLAYGGGAGIFMNTNNNSSGLYGLDVYNGSSHVLYAENDIRVGIGTNLPNYNLDVRGTIGNNTTLYHSDVRWKTRIEPVKYGINDLIKLNGVSYYWNLADFPEMNFDNSPQIGFIAQEFEKIIPELVSTGKDGYKSIDYVKITPLIIEGLKEQQNIINSQKADIETLKEQVNALQEKIVLFETFIAKSERK